MANVIFLVIVAIALMVVGAAWRLLEGAVGRWGLAGIFAIVVTVVFLVLWDRLRQAQVDNLWNRLHQAEADIEELGQRVQELEKKRAD